MFNLEKMPKTVWFDWGIVKAIDCTKLPFSIETIELPNSTDTLKAVQTGQISGFDSVGAALSFGLVQELNQSSNPNFSKFIDAAGMNLLNSGHGIKRAMKFVMQMQKEIKKHEKIEIQRKEASLKAENLAKTSVENCKKIGEKSKEIIGNKRNFLLHGRGNWTSFIERGTFCSALISAREEGLKVKAIIAESKPLGNGLDIAAELDRIGIPFTFISDTAVGRMLKENKIDAVFSHSTEIAMNGDSITDIGGYQIAVAAYENSIPVYQFSISDAVSIDEKNFKKRKLGDLYEENFGKVNLEKEKKANYIPDNFPQENHLLDVVSRKYSTALVSEKGVYRLKHHTLKGLVEND